MKNIIRNLIVSLMVLSLGMMVVGCTQEDTPNPPVQQPEEQPKVVASEYRGDWKGSGSTSKDFTLTENKIIWVDENDDPYQTISVWTVGTNLQSEERIIGTFQDSNTFKNTSNNNIMYYKITP